MPLFAIAGCAIFPVEAPGVGDCRNLVVFDSNRGGRSDVVLLDLASRDLRNLTRYRIAGTRNWLPDLSPGGAEIVFVSEDSAGIGQLFVVNADGSGLRQLTRQPAHYENPAWSIDGEWIAFERGVDDNWVLYAVRPDGTDLRRVGPEGHSLFHPAWAPDGQRIAVVTGVDDAWVAAILSVDSNALQRATQPGLEVGSVKWSPDGTALALDAAAGGNYDLYVLNVESGALERLTDQGAVDARPEWSPDGTRLVFHSTRDQGGSAVGEGHWDQFEIYVLDLATGNTDRLTENAYFDGHPDWCWPAAGG